MDQSGANGSHPNQQDGQGHGQGLDQQHGQPAVPMIHRSVDDILSADFPPGIGSALPSDNVHANYMDGLDDLFSDVPMNLPGGAHFPGLPPNSSAIGSVQSHQQPQQQTLQQPQPPTQLQQPQYIDQNGPGTVVTPVPSFPQLPGQQQLHMPLPSNTIQPLSQGSHIQLTPTVVTIPPTMPQGPIQSHISLPNGRPAGAPALTAQPIRPPNAGPAMLAPPPALVAQAGSPLHKILNSVSPATGQQLTNLFALLQSNAVTPSEFLAQAERLLEPAQFEILDGIRRRHPPAATDRSAASGTPGSAAPLPAGSSASTPTPAVATPGSSSTVSTPAATPGPSTVPMLPPTRSTISPALPSLPNVATPPSRVTPSTPTAHANVITPTLPPASSTTQSTPQSAPVRKRNTDTTANTPGSEAISKPTKRVKTEAQSIPTPGANGASMTPTPALPSTGGSSTPTSGAPSPGAFNRVSLPGQQKAAATPTPGVASGSQAGASTGAGSSAARSAAAAAANEKTNYDNITDVMGYVGVDLKEESDNIMRDNDGYSKSGGGADGQDRTRIQNFVNATLLKAKMERIATSHKLTVDADVLTYVAMAAQERLRGLAEQMIHASKHRGQSQSTTVPPLYDEDHAMYKVGVTQDVKKQLLAIERVEREEEFKRKEMIAERERKAALGEDLDENGEPRSGGGAGGAGSGNKKKKQKEGGPGVSARNMTEEARKKVANQTALGFAGGSGRSYSWMMGGGGAGGGGGGGSGGGAGGGAASPMASSGSGAASASSPAASGSSKPSLSRTSTMPASTPSISVGGASPGHISGAGSPSLSRGVSVGGGGSMVLPPSTLGRPASLRDTSRKVNVKDALFCLERDRGGGGGEGSGQRVLVKTYVKWLK
ncbi:hypothetical protein BGZ74_001961 [Mortierella antarctica]|nr:hypothetical protein BGZ74_001961 [Mortierella antarctica]